MKHKWPKDIWTEGKILRDILGGMRRQDEEAKRFRTPEAVTRLERLKKRIRPVLFPNQ